MPSVDREALPPSGDLQAAIRAIREEVAKMAASASQESHTAQGVAGRRCSRAGAERERSSESDPTGERVRPPLRILPAPPSGQAVPPTSLRENPPRRARRLLAQGLRQRRARSRPVGRVPQEVIAQDLVRSIAEEIHAGTTVIGGWMELLERGMLAEDELVIAAQRIRAAKARIELASERLELTVGIHRRPLR